MTRNKHLLSLLAVLPLVGALVSCTSSTDLGECAGVGETRDPSLVYETDVGNIIIAVFFSSTVIIPAVVVFDELWCPVAKAQ